MANTKISALATATTPLTGSELVPVVQNGTTVKATFADFFPSGMFMAFAGATAPSGFLAADGDTIGDTGSGADYEGSMYETLFDIVKDSWGNAGTEVFGDGDTVILPDLRGAFLRGTGSHGTETMADGNAYAGPSAVGEFEDDQMQQITGEFNIQNANGSQSSGAFTGTSSTVRTGIDTEGQVSTGSVIAFDSADSTAQGGARTGDETRPFAAGVLYVIKI